MGLFLVMLCAAGLVLGGVVLGHELRARRAERWACYRPTEDWPSVVRTVMDLADDEVLLVEHERRRGLLVVNYRDGTYEVLDEALQRQQRAPGHRSLHGFLAR